MRFYNWLLSLVLFSMLSLTSVHAQDNVRVYIPEDSIEVVEDGFLLTISEDEQILMDILYEDDLGFFVHEASLLDKIRGLRTCLNCGHKNPWYQKYCEKCHDDMDMQ